MKTISRLLRCPFLFLLFALTLHAQTTEQPDSSMSWEDLIEKWLALAQDGKNAAALPFARAALEKAFRDSSENSLEYGSSLDNLGYSLHHTGQLKEAEQVMLAAVEHARVHLGENDEDYITRLSNLAMLHMETGEIAKSALELESVVHLAELNMEPDNPYIPILINNLGLAYEKMGALDRALECYLRALDLTERSVGRDNVRYAIRLLNIAGIYQSTGKNENALDFSLRALEILKKTTSKDQPIYIAGLNRLIGVYNSLSRYEEAMPLSEEMLALMDKQKVKESVDSYNYLYTVADLYRQTGQYQRCADLAQATMLIYRKDFPQQYAQHASMARLAMLSLEKLGKLQEAATYARLLNQYSLEELRENFSQFSEDEQLAQYHVHRQNNDASYFLFAVQHPEFPELAEGAYDYQMTVKGLSLYNRRELFQSLRNNPSAPLTATFEAWQRLQKDISRQYALPPAKRQINLDSLLGAANELERNLALGSEPFRLTNQAPRWQDVQAALQPDEAAIEFGQLNTSRIDSILYYAWVLRPGVKLPQQVFLFEEKTLGSPAALRRLYAYAQVTGGKNLHQLLWEPLEPFLQGVSTLYIAPAGMLNQINMGAVPLTETEVLADRFKIHRLISTRQVPAVKSSPVQMEPTSAMVFGGIRYETDSLALMVTNMAIPSTPSALSPKQNRGLYFGDEWDYLPGSMQEASDVRRQLENAGARVVFANGFNASEGFFKRTVQVSPSPALLHLATHGFFLNRHNSQTHSGFSANENPMTRAGLVLAGANRVWSGQEPIAQQEDGILTALEISQLDLSGTTLAVLSACGTGQGQIEAGEGVIGLQRGFKMAGVRYLIMTLWNVQDRHAQQFMGYFYEEWLTQKKSVPDAFRAAQLKMRAAYSKPFQPMAWAGFILLE